MAKLIDGKSIAAEIRSDIKRRTEEFKISTGVVPGLAVVLVGDDPASQIYVNNKKKACAEVGFYSKSVELPADVTMEKLLSVIEELKNDPAIHGILVQFPLPKGLDENVVIAAIPPEKDVDAFNAVNVGKIMIGDFDFLPGTPAGVMKLLEHEGVEIAGKECVVVGRSNIVGKPQAMLLLHANGTVTICHSRTKNLSEITRRADILVVAVGKAGFITGDMIKPGAVVIDVGINRSSDPNNKKIVGDVDFESAEPVASMITPVPGGVGPMTITVLLENTLTAAKKSVR